MGASDMLNFRFDCNVCLVELVHVICEALVMTMTVGELMIWLDEDKRVDEAPKPSENVD